MRVKLNISTDLRDLIQRRANKVGLPMTQYLETLVNNEPDIDWSKVGKRDPWSVNFEKVQVHKDKPIREIMKITGLTRIQCDVMSHKAHIRCLKHLRGGEEDPEVLSEECEVTLKFAKAIIGRFTGEKKIPKTEKHLY